MSHTFYAQGVVLHRRDYTETSYIYTLYTREYGKISAHCRGSKKTMSKMAPFLENYDVLRLFIAQGRTRLTIIGVEQAYRFPGLFLDYTKIIYASYCLELIERLMKNDDRDEEVFEIISSVLELIEQSDGYYDLIVYSFTFKLMVALGFTPQLYSCLRCGKDIEPDGNIFSVPEGGVLCIKCAYQGADGGIEVEANTIKLLRVIAGNDLSHIVAVAMEYDIRHQFIHIIQRYFQYHIDRNIQSLKLLNFSSSL